MTSEQRSRHSPAAALRLSTAAGAAADSTVVIVDDEPANVALLDRLLGAAGVVRVHGFTDSRQALAYCAGSLPDLVLLDLHMPGLDGFSFMEALQGLVPEGGFLPVLVLTADVTHEVKERALATGAKDFLTKPLDRTEVLLRVSNLLETRALAGRLERKNRELEAFSYSVSHDLRAPLRGIYGLSQVLLEDYAGRLDETGEDLLRRIRTATQRMGELIDALLQLSRLGRAELRRDRVDLSSIAQSVAAELAKKDPDRQVAVRIQDGLVAEADYRLMRIALENLLGNAWKFTANASEAVIELGSEQRADMTVFFVRDNGAGFDMTHVDKLFRPFQRLHADADFPGTGIGLATVHRIIDRHGGRVWAEGMATQGATFYFTIPSASGGIRM
jgi:signal transduction histidine kinase